jgi:mannose-1-phosphate guanylyltransferase
MRRSERNKRWGVILAGGDGVRLRPLTRFICGDERPKQFCPLYGGVTLLEQARSRAARSIPGSHLLYSLTRAHEEFYLRTLVDCPSRRVVQPYNRGTGLAILSSLLVVAQTEPDATAAVFPSDHYYSDEEVITEAVEAAFDLTCRERDSIVLVGARPHSPETEYGWIETGLPVGRTSDSFRVRGFLEKPSDAMARLLLEQGSLWNTFVMVGRVLTFVEMICSALPGILNSFRHPALRRAPNEEIRIADSLYAGMPSVDFSRQVLSMETERLIVQRMNPVTWNDLGDCDRALAVVSRGPSEPDWAKRWQEKKRAATLVVASGSAVA